MSFSRIIMLLFTAVVSLWDIGLLLLLFLIEVLLLLVLLGDILLDRNIVTIIKTIRIVVRLLVSCGIVNIILRLLQDCRVDYLRLSGNSFRVRILRIGADVHVGIVVSAPFLLKGRPSFLSNQRIIVLILCVFLEEGLRCWTLTLVVMGAHVTADIFTLVEVRIVNVLFHSWLAHVRARAHHYSCSTSLIGVVQDISVCNVLCVNGTTAFDHRQLLGI